LVPLSTEWTACEEPWQTSSTFSFHSGSLFGLLTPGSEANAPRPESTSLLEAEPELVAQLLDHLSERGAATCTLREVHRRCEEVFAQATASS
jgi:hypothetical protein